MRMSYVDKWIMRCYQAGIFGIIILQIYRQHNYLLYIIIMKVSMQNLKYIDSPYS
jgi:hypothetical protein